MTTEAAAQQYLEEHKAAHANRGYCIFNPHDIPVDDLPVIYGFNNGGSRGWYSAVAMAEDGTVLGGHTCSDESYMYADLGILEGTRPDRHEGSYQKHYPDGYKMDFVSYSDVKAHEKLQTALALNKKQAEA